MRTIFTVGIVAILLAAVHSPASAETQQPIDQVDKFKPIALKCPDTNGGVFELVAKKQSGQKIKTLVRFRGASRDLNVKIIDVSYTKGSTDVWDQPLTIDLGKKNPHDADVAAEKILRIVRPITLKVCNGTSEQKKHFEQYLQGNAAELQAKP